jgi:transcriptional regulator with XRE-family HTH domain
MPRANITNKEIAEILKLDHTTVSRYRSGDRVPSLDVLLDIATEFNWDLVQQAISRKADTWARDFEEILRARHGEVEDDAPVEATSD